MKKIIFWIVLLLMIIVAPLSPARAQQPASIPVRPKQVITDVYSLIAEVNALRAANGLPAYAINSILMSVSQTQAEYMAAIRSVTHYDASGRRPYQRGLAAGYPLAGDLTLGGFYSENIMAGNNLSVQAAVEAWKGDTPHLTTMLAPGLQEIGAGVALVGGYVYYVIDCARPTGSGQPQPYTPGLGVATDTPEDGTAVFALPLASTIIPSTPLMDGRLYHVVGPGETLWLIAISYGVKIADIRRMNNLTDVQDIYPGNKLLIREGVTASPEPSTPTPALSGTEGIPSEATFTPVPTWTPLPVPTLTPTAPVPVAPVSSNTSVLVLGMIILAALLLAGIFVRAGQQKH